MDTNNEIKRKIELVATESFKKSKEKNFADLNFVFPKGKNETKFFKSKIEIVNQLDPYSQTFLSIFTRARIALREFQELKFDGNCIELVRLILTLPDSLKKSKLKSVEIKEKEERIVEKELPKEEEKPKPVIQKKKVKLIKPETTGKKMYKKKIEEKIMSNALKELNF